jgi:hypothetical protein
MGTVTRLVTKYDVLRVLNKRDEALKALPVPLSLTTAGNTTTLIDTKLGRGTTNPNKYDARGVEIMSELASVAITSSSIADPTVITTASAHGYGAGLVHSVVISGHIGSVPDINGEWLATQTGASTATIPVVVTTGGTGGTITELSDYVAVDDGGFNGTSTLTYSPAVTVLPAVGLKYLLYPHGVSGDMLDQVADEILRQTDAPYVYFPSLVNDSAIETIDVATDWPDVVAPGGTATELVATSANVLFGQQSVHGVADGAGQGWNSQTFDVHETETLMVSVTVRAAVGSVIVQLYNETAPEVVKAVTIDEPAWTEIRFQETVPDNCEQMRIRILSAAAADDFYMAAPVIVQVTGDMRPYTAPSWFVSEEKVRYAFYMPQGRVSEDADSYVALSRQWRSAQAPAPTFINEARGVNPLRIVLRAVWSRPVGIVLSRGFDAFTDNTTTTTCDRDYLVAAIIARFYRDWDEQADFRRWARRRRARELALGYNLKETRIVPNQLVSV